jgi:demethylmenaquinone methyltransferase/2-methoxy-6-polyprenyl-1,4-benzoquinol methylase
MTSGTPGGQGRQGGHKPGRKGARADSRQETDFGFRRVEIEDHPSLVRQVFDSVAERYDLMNDLMSGGLHRLWKRALIDRVQPRPGMRLIDIAGGTGDIAGRFLARAQDRARTRDPARDPKGPDKTAAGAAGAAGAAAEVVICDLNLRMLEVGAAKLLDRGVVDGISRLCCNAESLPLADGCADAATIAFGLRNVTRRKDALAEARRVLKPGGHFLCLEFSPAVLPALAPLYDAYSYRILPLIGGMVTGDRAAYQYLVESIRRFPGPEILAREMGEAGFDNVDFTAYSGGIVALHSGWRI